VYACYRDNRQRRFFYILNCSYRRLEKSCINRVLPFRGNDCFSIYPPCIRQYPLRLSWQRDAAIGKYVQQSFERFKKKYVVSFKKFKHVLNSWTGILFATGNQTLLRVICDVRRQNREDCPNEIIGTVHINAVGSSFDERFQQRAHVLMK
jgi:hypothetical protein